MKNVLVVYYSQSGQLKQILQSILRPLVIKNEITITYEELRPQPAYPFPWNSQQFCDVFPESFQEIPCELEPLNVDTETQFDMVIIAYTVWYLSPSIPISAFLQSEISHKLLNGRPIVTIIGCRNMWLQAQEKMKNRILDRGGRLMGNIVLSDKSPNLIGVITIAHWMFTGRKDRLWKIFPKPGVADKDIEGAQRFGDFFLEALSKPIFELDQSRMNQQGAVRVVPAFILFEQRIEKVFSIWSRFIRQKGGPGNPRRQKRVRVFYYYLLVAIFLIAPVATVLSVVVQLFRKEKLQHAVSYFSRNELKI